MAKRIRRGTNLLLVLSLLCASGTYAEETTPNRATIEFSGDELVIPLDEGAIHPIAPVNVEDEESYNFVVDTGASVNVIDVAIAEANDYQVVGETSVGAPGGDTVDANVVRVPELRIGDGVIRNAEFVALDIRSMTSGLMDGIISLRVFEDYLLTFDQARGRIRVTRETLSPDSYGVQPYHDFSGHLQIDVDVAGTTVATHVDTGSMASFTLPIELISELPLMDGPSGSTSARLVGGDRNVVHAQLDGDIVFAGTRYENPTVGFMDPSPGYGNVGSGVLNEFAVSIDQQNRLIRFERNAVEENSTSTPRRLGVQFRGFPGGDSLTVGRVEAGSLGEQYGILSGDVLVAVNGKPTGEYDMPALGAVMRGPQPLTLQIVRDGSELTIEIP